MSAWWVGAPRSYSGGGAKWAYPSPLQKKIEGEKEGIKERNKKRGKRGKIVTNYQNLAFL